MSHVDDEPSVLEFEVIIRQLDREFHLMDSEAAELREIGEQLIKNKAKIDEFLDVMNDQFSREQKQKVLDMALQVAHADGIFDKYEKFFSEYIRERLNLK